MANNTTASNPTPGDIEEIVVISGKGGTGKTSLTASFALICGDEAVIADCDVDASDMHLLLNPVIQKQEDFYSGKEAEIHQKDCIACGKCLEVCRFDAVLFSDNGDGEYSIDTVSCEGCGYCAQVCPSSAIEMNDALAGEWYVSRIRSDATMVHARLGTGADNSGKLVARVKNLAKEIAVKDSRELVLVDGSPGIGCPVVSSLSGADYVVMVTEPTISGLHDLKRLHELVSRFHIRGGVIVNKADLNLRVSEQIREFAECEEIGFLGTLPYDDNFSAAMVKGLSIIEEPFSDSPAAHELRKIWDRIRNNI